MSQNGKYAFILGHPKSGTSIVRALLDGHPELCTLSEESDFYRIVWPEVQRISKKRGLSNADRAVQVYSIIAEKSQFRRYFQKQIKADVSGNLPYQDVDSNVLKSAIIENLNSVDIDSRKSVFAAILHAYQHAMMEQKLVSDRSILVEKTPIHTWYVDCLLEDFPKAKFLFVYRDPRDNYVSYKKKRPSLVTPFSFAKSWLAAFNQIESIPENRIAWLKYEDLCLRPRETCELMADFFAIEFDASLLSPTKLGKHWHGNSMFGDRKSKLDSGSLGRFRDYPSQKEIRLLEMFTYDRAISLGYEYPKDVETPKSLQSRFEKSEPCVGVIDGGWKTRVKRHIRRLRSRGNDGL